MRLPLFLLRPLCPSKRRDLDKAQQVAAASRSHKVLNHRRRDRIFLNFRNSSNNSSPRRPLPRSKRICNNSNTFRRIRTDLDFLIPARRRRTMPPKVLRLSRIRISINSAQTDTLLSKVPLARSCRRCRPELLVSRNTPIRLCCPLSTLNSSSTTSNKDWYRWVPAAVVLRPSSRRCTLSRTSPKRLHSEWVLDRPSSRRRSSNNRSPVDHFPRRTASLLRWVTLRNTSLSSSNSNNECRRPVPEVTRIRLVSLSKVVEGCLGPRWISWRC